MQGVELATAQPRGKTICQGPAFLKEEERKRTIILPPPHNQQIGAEAEAGREVICWGREGLIWGRGGKNNKMKTTIAKRLSEFCWADVWLQPAAGEEVVQQGKERTSVSFGLGCPLPRAISDERLRCLAHSLELHPRAASSHEAGFRQRQGLEMRRQREERRGERRRW